MSSLATAFQHYKSGHFPEAEKQVRQAIRQNPRDVKAHHLLAIVLKAQAEYPKALTAINKALKLAADDNNILLEKIQILSAAGSAKEASQCAELLLKKTPGHLNASIVAGNYWLQQDYPEQALKIFEKALLKMPGHPTLLRGKVFALKDICAHDEAWEVLNLLGDEADLYYTKGQLYMEGFKPDKAIAMFRQAMEHLPSFGKAARDYLQCHYMLGGTDRLEARFAELCAKHAEQPELFILGANIFKEIGQTDKALELIELYEKHQGANGQSNAVKAGILIEKNDFSGALTLAKNAHLKFPDNILAIMNMTRAALMVSDFDLALEIARGQNGKDDQTSYWNAIEVTALRAKGAQKQYTRLIDYDAMIGVYDLETPDGFESLQDFLSSLKNHLLELHEWDTQPLFQSLRNGTQTTQDLRHSKHPILQSFFSAIKPHIKAYIEKMPLKTDHPFYRRKSRDFRFSGAWSVALRSDGFHVNHIHPKGWISSSFYVDVPDSVQDHPEKAGWIKFGEPPFKVADLKVQRYICPKPGRLVLFPSYMWHGTVPFTEGEQRLTLPFDVMPLD